MMISLLRHLMNNQYVISILAIFIFIISVENFANAEHINEHYQRGIEYRKVGQFQNAITSFEKVINITKSDVDINLLADTHYQIASTLHGMEEYNKAIIQYQQAISLNSNSYIYHNALGITHSELKQYKTAIDAFKKAIELSPKTTQLHYNLGLVYLKQGVFQLAETAFKNALAVDSNWTDAYIGLGEIYLKRGNLDKAENVYLKLTDTKSNGSSGWSGLGQVYAKQKRYKQAKDAFTKVIKIEGDNTQAHYHLAQLYNKLGEKELAASTMAFFKVLRQTDPLLEKARKWVKIHPNDPKGYNNLGIIYLMRKRFDKAIENYKHAISLSPKLATTHYNLGHAYHKHGKLNLAIKAYQNAISYDGKLAIAHNNIAVCYAELDQKLEKALIHAKAATSLAPDEANYWDTLATVYTHLGLDSQAKKALQKKNILLSQIE